MSTKTTVTMLPDHKTKRFVLPNGITHDVRSAMMRDSKALAGLVDQVAALAPSERQIVQELLGLL